MSQIHRILKHRFKILKKKIKVMLSYDVECSIFFPNFMDKFMAMEGEFTQND